MCDLRAIQAIGSESHICVTFSLGVLWQRFSVKQNTRCVTLPYAVVCAG